MMISASNTVREVATRSLRATEVFEDLRIDYCCGADASLAEACSKVGLPVDPVLRMLRATDVGEHKDGSADLSNLSLTELIMLILDRHHIFAKQQLTRMEHLLAKVLAAHAADHPELRKVARLWRTFGEDLKAHMFKEEQILFPYIVQVERALLKKGKPPFGQFVSVKNPIQTMVLEHDSAGELLHALRNSTSDYAVPPDACPSYHELFRGLEALERDLHRHIHLENNLLFPRAIEMEEKL